MNGPRWPVAVLLLPILLFAADAHGGRCRQREDDVHAPYRQLTWKDFKGTLPRSFSQESARISSIIKLKTFEVESRQEEGGLWVSRPVEICLFTSMHKYDSARRVGMESPPLLAHEQTHFDLTEYFTRSFRVWLEEVVVRHEDAAEAAIELRSQVAGKYQQVLHEWNEMQETYDTETAHGTQKRRQRRWQGKVRDLLASVPAASAGS